MSDFDPDLRDRRIEEQRRRVSALTFNDRIPTEQQSKIVDMVLREVENDEKTRAEYLVLRQEVLDVYEGRRDKKKDFPFDGCADVKTKLLASSVELTHSRLYPAVYNENLLYWKPREVSDIAAADRVGKFMPWALEQASFSRFADDWVYALVLEGTEVTKVRWDIEWRWVSRRVPKPAKFAKKLQDKIRNLIAKVTKKVTIDETDYEIKYDYVKFEKAVVEQVPLEDVGFPVHSSPLLSVDSLHHIWHRTRPLLSRNSELGESGFFIEANVSNLRQNRQEQVLEEMKGTERTRREAEGTTAAMPPDEEIFCENIERYGKINVPGLGMVECVVWVEAKTRTFLGCMPLVNINRAGCRPFAIAQFVRRKNRMYGLGLGDLGGKEIELEINAIHNQRLDVGTMSIVPPGLYRASSGFEPEELRMAPGLWIPVDDINDARPLILPNNTIQGFQEENLLIRLMERITAVGELQAGQESSTIGTRATAKGTLAILAEGERRFNTLAMRMQEQMARVLKLILQMWQTHLPPGVGERVLGPNSEAVFPEGLSPEDIVGDFDVHLALDPTAGSKSMERQFAFDAYNLLLQNPLVMQNPAHMWELSAGVLRAGKHMNIEAIIGPKPESPSAVTLPATIFDELAEIRQGRLRNTQPADNPFELLFGMSVFKTTSDYRQLTLEQRKLVDVRVMVLQAEMINRSQQMQMQNTMSEAGVPTQPAVRPASPEEQNAAQVVAGLQSGAGVEGEQQPGGLEQPAQAPVAGAVGGPA